MSVGCLLFLLLLAQVDDVLPDVALTISNAVPTDDDGYVPPKPLQELMQSYQQQVSALGSASDPGCAGPTFVVGPGVLPNSAPSVLSGCSRRYLFMSLLQ